MKHLKLLVFLKLTFLYLNVAETATPECHWKAMDKCLYGIFYFTHRPNTTGIVPTSKEFELMCKVKRKVFWCMERFLDRCGTDTFTGIFRLLKEQILNSFKQLCDDGPKRRNFIKYSPCIHASVKQDPLYKQTCVNDLQAGLELTTSQKSLQDIIDTGCCVYNTWEDCIMNMTEQRCGGGGDAVHDLIEKASGGLIHITCKRDLFDPKSELCHSKRPPKGTQALGRKSNSVFSKYFTLICPNTGW